MINLELYKKYAEFLRYDDDGENTGLREDAPKEAKEAYQKQKEWEETFSKKNEPIPR